MKRAGAICLVLMLVGALVVLVSCHGDGDAASWQLTEEPAGSELHIGVFRGACDLVKSVSANESDSTVTVTARLTRDYYSTDGSCTSQLEFERHTLRLERDLGDRSLTGCNPSGPYEQPGISDSDCRASVIGTP